MDDNDAERQMRIGDAVAEIAIAVAVMIIICFLSSCDARAANDVRTVEYNRLGYPYNSDIHKPCLLTRFRLYPLPLAQEIVPCRAARPYPLYLRK